MGNHPICHDVSFELLNYYGESPLSLCMVPPMSSPDKPEDQSTGEGTKSVRETNRTAIVVASIGATATIVGGIIAAVFAQTANSPEAPSATSQGTIVPTTPPPEIEAGPNPTSFLSGEVAIGITGDAPGWSLWDGDENHAPTGFDIDLVTFLRKKYAFTPKFVKLRTSEREAALQTGRVGMIVSNYSMTSIRAEKVDFAGPYFKDQSGLLASKRKIDLLGINSSIPVHQLCVTSKVTASVYLKRRGASPLIRDSLPECLRKLDDPNDREIVGVVTDQTILAARLAHHPDKDKIVSPSIWVGENTPIEPAELYGIGIPKNSPKLCEALSSDIKEFLDSPSGWKAAFKRNLYGQEPDAHKPASSSVACGPPLTIQ